MLLNHIPVPGEVGICGRALEHHRRYAQQQWGVHHICMASNPSHVATTEEDVGIVDIEHVLPRHCSAQEIPRRRVHHALRLASRARSVQKEQWVLGVHDFGGDICRPLLDFLVPPPVAALGHGHVGASAFVNQAVGDIRALLEGIVDDLFSADQLASTLALVAGNNNLALRIIDTIAQGVGRETSEDDRMHGADARAGQESDQSLGNHGEIDGYGIALLDAHLLEHVGGLADLT